MTKIKNNYIVNSYRIHSIENKFVSIKVKCKCVLCSPNFVGEREEPNNFVLKISLTTC